MTVSPRHDKFTRQRNTTEVAGASRGRWIIPVSPLGGGPSCGAESRLTGSGGDRLVSSVRADSRNRARVGATTSEGRRRLAGNRRPPRRISSLWCHVLDLTGAGETRMERREPRVEKDKDRDKERGRLVARTTSARGVATPTPTRAVRASVCFEEQREATSLDLWIAHVDRESILCGLKKTVFLVVQTC